MSERSWREKHPDELSITSRITRAAITKKGDKHVERHCGLGITECWPERVMARTRILVFVLFAGAVAANLIVANWPSLDQKNTRNREMPVLVKPKPKPKSETKAKVLPHVEESRSTTVELFEGKSIWHAVRDYLESRGLDASEQRVKEVVDPFIEETGIDPYALPEGWSFTILEAPDGTITLFQS
jgi:hypothetical protein